MTREEQLQFCKVCKNKRMDVQKGIVCALTGEQGDFDGVCEQYQKDEVEIERERVKRDYQAKKENEELYESMNMSGSHWFAWIGGLSIVNIILESFGVQMLFGLGMTSALSWFGMPGIILASLISITYIVIYKLSAVNKYEWAYRLGFWFYLIDVVFILILMILSDNNSLLIYLVVHLILLVILYDKHPFYSKAMLKKSRTEKWSLTRFILIVCIVLSSCLTTIATYYLLKPSNENFLSNMVFDKMIEMYNKEIKYDENSSISLFKIDREGNVVIKKMKVNGFTGEYNEKETWEVSLLNKQSILFNVSNLIDRSEFAVEEEFFNAGFVINYRVYNSNDVVLYESIITKEEFYKALESGNKFKCDEDAFVQLVDYYANDLYPMEHITGLTYFNVKRDDSSLKYKVKLPKESVPSVINQDFMEKFIKDNWIEFNDNLQKLASINKDTIVYSIFSGSNDFLYDIKFAHNQYIKFQNEKE